MVFGGGACGGGVYEAGHDVVHPNHSLTLSTHANLCSQGRAPRYSVPPPPSVGYPPVWQGWSGGSAGGSGPRARCPHSGQSTAPGCAGTCTLHLSHLGEGRGRGRVMGVWEGHGGGEREQRQHHCGIGTPTVTLSYICMYLCTCVQMTTTASVFNGVHRYAHTGSQCSSRQ